MSTKTTLKRVAFVVVTALGLSMAQNAYAVDVPLADITSVTIAAPGTGRVGETLLTTVDVVKGANTGANQLKLTLRARFDSRPAGSAAAIGFSTAGLTMVDTTGGNATLVTGAVKAQNAAGNELLPAYLELSPATNMQIANNSAGTKSTAGSVGFVPDVNGSYVFTVWHDQDLDGVLDSGEKSDTDTFVVGNTATTVTMSNIGGTPAASGFYGALVKIVFKDSAGGVAGLSAAESIGFGSTSGATVTVRTPTGGDGGTTIENADIVNGVAYVNVVKSANTTGTVTLIASGSGGSVGSLQSSLALSFKAVDTSYTGTWTRDADDYFYAASATATSVDIPLGASTVTYNLVGSATAEDLAADAYVGAEIRDYSGRVTASKSVANGAFTDLRFDRAALVDADLEASIAISATTALTGEEWRIDIVSGTGAGVSSTTHTVATNASGAITITNDYIAAKTAGSVTITANATDKFGRVLPNASVQITSSAASRNYAPSTAVTAVTKLTDSLGNVSFTWTDSSTSTTLFTDAITLSSTFGGETDTDSATVVWSATGPVASTITLTGGNVTAGVTAATVSTKDIAAGVAGAQAGTQTFSATVKDAGSNLLQGVVCTWSITDSGTKANVLSTKVDTYTSGLGVCTTSVYAWIAGTYTVSVTAAGATSSGTITFGQTAAGEERTISASASGSIVTAKVVDRFGNPVPGVTVYATKTGAGYFGTGVTKTSTTTNASGEAEFSIAGGDAVVTVSTINYDAVAGTYGSGQTSAPKGYSANSSSAATLATYAFDAYVAGTTAEAEEGVGATFDAAGVASASVTLTGVNTAQVAAEAASDAAAEAIDAANAATDAANLAAEAADAATVAAEEARDAADAATAAVEELATQVATLMAALKAQITTLANTVAKIAKKVKA